MKKQHSFWPVELIETQLNFDTKHYINALYNFRKKHPNTVRKSNYGGYQTDSILHHSPDFFPLINQITSFLAKNIFEKQVIMRGCWGNISSKHNYNQIHTHDCDISGVIYLKVPENSGAFLLHNPQNVSYLESFIPYPNAMYLFKSNIPHSVSQNLSDEDRISIAFNCDLI